MILTNKARCSKCGREKDWCDDKVFFVKMASEHAIQRLRNKEEEEAQREQALASDEGEAE